MQRILNKFIEIQIYVGFGRDAICYIVNYVPVKLLIRYTYKAAQNMKIHISCENAGKMALFWVHNTNLYSFKHQFNNSL